MVEMYCKVVILVEYFKFGSGLNELCFVLMEVLLLDACLFIDFDVCVCFI